MGSDGLSRSLSQSLSALTYPSLFVGGELSVPGRSSCTQVEAGKTYHWCACGKSNNQPFCDGSHKGSQFNPLAYSAEETKTVYLCQCKETAAPPFCDGAHEVAEVVRASGRCSKARAKVMTNVGKMETSLAGSRWKAWVPWVLQVILGLAFVAAGGAKLAGVQQFVELFDKIGLGLVPLLHGALRNRGRCPAVLAEDSYPGGRVALLRDGRRRGHAFGCHARQSSRRGGAICVAVYAGMVA
jgi:CDGSH-type Zn-finger protein